MHVLLPCDLVGFGNKAGTAKRHGHNSMEVPLGFLVLTALQLMRSSSSVCVHVCVLGFILQIESDSWTRQLSLSCVLLYWSCALLSVSRSYDYSCWVQTQFNKLTEEHKRFNELVHGGLVKRYIFPISSVNQSNNPDFYVNVQHSLTAK